MPDIAARAADLCVLDICINEQRASQAKQYDFAESWRALDFFAERCTTLGMLPLILLLPQWNPKKGFQTAAIDLWKAQCSARRLPVLDVIELAQQLNPDSPGDLWPDASHPSFPLSTLIADRIFQAYERISCAVCEVETREVHNYIRVSDFDAVRVERINSRFRQVFWEMPAEFPVEVNVGEPASIVGLGLNAAHTNGALRIEGDCVTEKYLDNTLFGPPRPMWHVVWNVISPVSSSTGVFRLQVVPTGPNNATERTDHFRRPDPSLEIDFAGRKVEIASAICRTNARPARVAYYQDVPILTAP